MEEASKGGTRLTGRVISLLLRYRTWAKVAADASAWAVAIPVATAIRYELAVRNMEWGGLAVIVPVAVLLQLGFGTATGLYRGRRRTGSFDELDLLLLSAGASTVALTAFNLAVGSPRLVPLSGTLGGGLAALALMGGARYAWRWTIERRTRPSAEESAHRMLVFGAGDGAAQILGNLLHTPSSEYVPVALIDDHLAKRHLRIKGVPVRGTREDIATVARQVRADTLLIAIPSASSALIREVSVLAMAAGLDVKVLPPVDELLNGGVTAGDIRGLTEADLLGRHEIDTDLMSIAGYLTGRRVLVTGAGGSIGSELCRQIHQFAPAELVMLDRDESALHAVQLSLTGRALLDGSDTVLCDLRDRACVREVFSTYRPEVVFHAAALKHLPLLQQYPGEAVRTNVWGTLDLLETARDTGVELFVNVSTDKAADPTSVLGYTKRMAECLTAHVAKGARGRFLSVRFGNVLGSRGSMLHAFRAQIDAGGPVTVTDPEVTRFFMTVEEAVQLVVQAGAIGSDGQALVLDMGEPVRIADVARQLAGEAPRPVDIVFTGLRPGEKLHETLWGAGEIDDRPVHPLISHVEVPPLEPEVALGLDPAEARDRLIKRLAGLCNGALAAH